MVYGKDLSCLSGDALLGKVLNCMVRLCKDLLKFRNSIRGDVMLGRVGLCNVGFGVAG